MKRFFIIFALVAALSAVAAAQQTSAFNFQGRLNDGNVPANGRYDLQFLLYDALVGGNQVGPIIVKPNLLLVNGVVSTALDFGSGAFASGGDRFLEIQLRPTVATPAPPGVAPNAFVILGARQQLLSVPFAVSSQVATTAAQAATAVSATSATNATNSQSAVNSQQLGGVDAGQYLQRNAPGTVKAMIHYRPGTQNTGVIRRCYNSTLSGPASTSGNCGFTVDNFTTGGYGINFGFNTANLIVSVSTGSNQVFNDGTPRNEPTFATWSFATGNNPNNINIFTWNDSGSATGFPEIMVVVY